jgi:hypothetical protein
MKGSIKMGNLDGFLASSKKIQKTKIVPLRWFANGISSIGSTCLVKAAFLDEDGDFGFKYRFYSRVWKVANFFYSRWGTYYELDMDEWLKDLKEDMAGAEWDDYDSEGNAYWQYHWNEDPLTGDAWRIKKKDIFETQVDFE